MRKYIVFCCFGMALCLACREDRDWEDPESEVVETTDIIHIGGVETNVLSIDIDEGSLTRGDDDGSGDDVDETVRHDAEELPWLLEPLFHGIDVRYGTSELSASEQVAILRLEKADPSGGYTKENIKYEGEEDSHGVITKLASYSFKYRNADGTEGDPAKWYGNGDHFFQGVYVPQQLRFKGYGDDAKTDEAVNDPSNGTAPSLMVDQHLTGASGTTVQNYTLLERYLAMPAKHNVQATVGRIKLPFRHRLARVIAYILIDPTMGPGVTLKDYNYHVEGDVVTPDNPTTTALRFCNVSVLAGVKQQVGDNGSERLHPQWKTARKVIPHFVGERGSVDANGKPVVGTTVENFYMFYSAEDKEYYFPTTTGWSAARNKWFQYFNSSAAGDTEAKKIAYANERSGYVRTDYGMVPCYDIIVRPTYKSADNVMYDEDLAGATKEVFAKATNKIDFELTLSNGLQYTKSFEFDLNADIQTAVYLRINRESVDYNSSGAEKWDNRNGTDKYYGVNNQNGNTLSLAGNSWQRAYRFADKNWDVTDGHQYKYDTEDVKAQYVTKAKWLEMFLQATESGAHHGDYFILDNDITIPAALLPADFVFTGHLDGQNHTITVTGLGGTVVDKDAYDEYPEVPTSDFSTVQEFYTGNSTDGYTLFSLKTLYEKDPENDVKYTAEELYEIEGKTYVIETLDPVKYTEETAAEENAKNEHHVQVEDENQKRPGEDGYIPTYGEAYIEGYIPASEGQDIPGVYQLKAQGSVAASTETVKTPAYKIVTPTVAEVAVAPAETYFTLENGVYASYSLPSPLYKKIHHEAVTHPAPGSLFAGLNGIYTTAQEAAVNPYAKDDDGNYLVTWQANVHKERGDKWVPVSGYRAELLNVKLKGGKFFPAGAVFTGKDLNKEGAVVSGYIYNCWELSTATDPETQAVTPVSTKITNEVPIPQY